MRVSKIVFVVFLILTVVLAALFIYAEAGRRQEIAWDRMVAEQYVTAQTPEQEGSVTDAREEQPYKTEDGRRQLPGLQVWRVDLEALRAVNGETVGWIWQPGTEINYPVMQGMDNTYYLTHRFDRSDSSEGAIYVDFRCPLDGHSVILYGHNTSSGKFDSLNQYLRKGKQYWEEHPYFIFYSEEHPAGVIYDIFSAFQADVSTPSQQKKIYLLPSDEEYPSYLNRILNCAELETCVEVSPERDMMLLSTCCYDKRSRCVVAAIARCTVPQYLASLS